MKKLLFLLTAYVCIMTCPTMTFATVEDVQTETEQVQDDLEKIVIDRNIVLIKQNIAYPMILDSETNEPVINEKYRISESYSNPQAMKWMSITKEQRDAIVQEIENDGKVFANQWRHVVIYEVIAQRPVSITYKVNGEKKTERVTSGIRQFFYETTDGDPNDIWSGYMTFINNNGSIQTVAFNGGTNFLY